MASELSRLHTFTNRIERAESVLCCSVALVSSRTEPSNGLRVALCDSPSTQISIPQLELRICVTLVRPRGYCRDVVWRIGGCY